MESTWLTWAKKLQSIAVSGLHFCNAYDKERYEEISRIATHMLAELSHTPIHIIENLAPHPKEGYVTPKIDVRGAVFQHDKILLVREAVDGKWTLPGGYADVGLSPAENVTKEMYEEASVHVRATHLYAVRHKAKHGYDPDIRDFYKLFFLCEATEEMKPAPGTETLDVGFFSLDALPILSTGRTIPQDLHAAYAYKTGEQHTVLFD